MAEYKKVKINKSLRGFAAGSEINLKCIGDVPVDPYWRARFEDAKTDNCVERVKPKNKTTKKAEQEK